MGSGDDGALDAVENGIVSLFSARVTVLASSWPTLDILLTCAVGFIAIKNGKTGKNGTPESVVQGVVLKLLLDSAGTIDEGLYLCNLICVFIVLHAFDAGGFGSAAKYVFATEIAGLFAANAFVGIMLGAAVQMNLAWLESMPRLRECAQLVVAQLGVGWFQGMIPAGMTFPTTLLFAYLLGPSVTDSAVDGVQDLYTFAMYQIAGSVESELPGTELWVQWIFAMLVWAWKPDAVTQTLGQFTAIQIGCTLVLNAATVEIRTDPVLATGLVVMGLELALSIPLKR